MQTRMITIDWELNEKLKKETNASALITRLLMDHYKTQEPKTLEQIEKAIAIEQERLRHEQTMRELTHGQTDTA